MKKFHHLPAIALAAVISSCGNGGGSSTGGADLENNPLLKVSTLPYHAPDFSAIDNSHFQPAMEFGMKEHLAEIEAIANNTEPPTFENTLVALEKSGQTLNRVYGVFSFLAGAYTNPEIQRIEEEEAPRMAAHQDAIYLNEQLFQRIKALYNQLESINTDPESKRLVKYYYQRFVLAGANLPDTAKEALKKLNEEEALLSAKFGNRLLAAAKTGAYVTTDKARLEGLSESELQAIAQKSENGTEQFVLPLHNTTQQPALLSLVNRPTRQELFERSLKRAEQGDSADTREIIARIAQIRAKQAHLLGYQNYAQWSLQDQMAKTPEAVNNFLFNLIPAVTKKISVEADDIQNLINQKGDAFRLEPYDWTFYAEQVRKARYDMDENEIKPYFELNTVLEKGVFYAATRLYGITFQERKDIPVYSPDVRVFELFNEDGPAIGLFYCDFFKRDNKAGGAWMGNVVEQSRLLGNKPVIYNVCNFTKPAEGNPALISFDDVTTLFHEFGHALHGFFADQQYPSLSGTNVARDFVELPSQINEHWALYPEVFKNYAIHYQTGSSMPQELADKLVKAAKFNQGYALGESLSAAALDMQWHTLTPDTAINDVSKFESEALSKIKLNFEQVPPRYRSTYFLHIWGHGYAAGYYAYLWAEMLDNDAFEWFKENGGLTRANGQRFREMILSRGNTEDYNQMFVKFRGKEPDITPMLRKRGLIE